MKKKKRQRKKKKNKKRKRKKEKQKIKRKRKKKKRVHKFLPRVATPLNLPGVQARRRFFLSTLLRISLDMVAKRKAYLNIEFSSEEK